jgi:hypothetical protein
MLGNVAPGAEIIASSTFQLDGYFTLDRSAERPHTHERRIDLLQTSKIMSVVIQTLVCAGLLLRLRGSQPSVKDTDYQT